MSFVQDKLSLVATQSVMAINLYVYEPANGDSIDDVITSGYFTQSRFIGTDGWANGFIFCNLSDGGYAIQVSSDGISATQFGAGGQDIPTLDSNVRGTALIDMGNDDYTMTDDEANCSLRFIINSGDGTKVLLSPISADSTTPKLQSFITGFAGNTFFYGSEAGGSPTEIIAPYNDLVNYTAGGVPYTMFNSFITQSSYGAGWSGNVQAPSANAVYDKIQTILGGVNVQTGASYSFLATDAGGLVVGNRGTAQTFTIEPTSTTDMGTDCQLRVQQQGAGNITISAGAGVTIVGSGAMTVDTSKTLKRDGDTDTWYVS